MSLHCDGAAGSCSAAPCLGAAHHNLLWYLEEDVRLHQQSDAGRSGLSWHQFKLLEPGGRSHPRQVHWENSFKQSLQRTAQGLVMRNPGKPRPPDHVGHGTEQPPAPLSCCSLPPSHPHGPATLSWPILWTKQCPGPVASGSSCPPGRSRTAGAMLRRSLCPGRTTGALGAGLRGLRRSEPGKAWEPPR